MTDEEVAKATGFESIEAMGAIMQIKHNVPLEHWAKMRPEAKHRLYLLEEFEIILDDEQ